MSQVGSPSSRDSARTSGLVKPGLDQRLARAALVGGAQARAVVAEIVEVGAEQHLGEAERVGARARDLEQLGLAVVAAVGRVLRRSPGARARASRRRSMRRADERGAGRAPPARSRRPSSTETAVSARAALAEHVGATRRSSVESTPPEKQTSAEP